jgi:hypothetical protein
MKFGRADISVIIARTHLENVVNEFEKVARNVILVIAIVIIVIIFTILGIILF